jgi:hypothetical protein
MGVVDDGDDYDDYIFRSFLVVEHKFSTKLTSQTFTEQGTDSFPIHT